MFSVPSYPRSDRYYSHKGQIIRRRRMDTPAPLSPQQLQQAYDYFIARDILFPPTPPPDTNIYIFYGPRSEDTVSQSLLVHVSSFPPASDNQSSISITTYDFVVAAVINVNDPSRIYFFSYYSGSSSYNVSWTSPYSLIWLINRNAGLSLGIRGGFLLLQYLFYIPVLRTNGVQINSDFLNTLPYVTVNDS